MSPFARLGAALRLGRKTVWPSPLNLTSIGGPAWGEGRADSGEIVSEGGVLALASAWACVNLLAGTIASLPLTVYRDDGNGHRVEARDHPLWRVLHDAPNYDQTALDFWELGAAALELRGNLYAWREQTGARLAALTPITSPVQPYRRDDGSIRYRWAENGAQRDEPQELVFHVRGFGGSPLGGLSTLAYGRQTFGLAAALNRAASSTFANGLRPSGALSFQQFLTDEQRAVIEGKVVQKFAGAMNAGRPMVLEGGSKWEPITFTPEDAEMLASRGFSVEEVCRLFGVPPFMIGHTEKTTSWGTGLEQQILGFQKFTLRRRLRRIEQAIAQQLFTPGDRAAGLAAEFNLDGLLRGDSGARAGFYNAGLQQGWLTVNEVRRRENLPPVDGGDVPRVQMQNVPLAQADALQPPKP